MTQKIPATVITGFLGAGKTTLVRHLLQNAGGRRIALIVNEFGDLGVDGEILKACGNEACTEDEFIGHGAADAAVGKFDDVILGTGLIAASF